MTMHFFDRLAKLEREHASFAIATVVARQSPVSAHLGDRALIFADGHMEGFVGGSCSRDLVRRQALGAIRSRQPVLLQIRNAETASRSGSPSRPDTGATTERVVIPMSCASEGAVDVYIEPRVPLRRLVVVGFTPVAEALAQVASSLDYRVVRVVIDDEMRDLGDPSGSRVVALAALREFVAGLAASEREALVAIVASQGHYDELALEVLAAFDIAFVGLLASRRRASTVFGVLTQQGIPPERLAMIRTPVGLDIGARNPGEVAVSILAEIIANVPAAVPVSGDAAATTDQLGRSARSVDDAGTASNVAVDPVCGMDVETDGALYHGEHGGRTFFFCCAGCRASFAADSERYLAASGNA